MTDRDDELVHDLARAWGAQWGVPPEDAKRVVCAAAAHARAEARAGVVPADPTLRLTYDLIHARSLLPDRRAAWRAMARAFRRHVGVLDPPGLLELDELPATLLVAFDDLDRGVTPAAFRPEAPIGGRGSTHAEVLVRAFAVAAVERGEAHRLSRGDACEKVAAAFEGLPLPLARPVTADTLANWRHRAGRRDDKGPSPHERACLAWARDLFAGLAPDEAVARLRDRLATWAGG